MIKLFVILVFYFVCSPLMASDIHDNDDLKERISNQIRWCAMSTYKKNSNISVEWNKENKPLYEKEINAFHFGEGKKSTSWGKVIDYNGDLIIGFHGTQSIGDWLINLMTRSSEGSRESWGKTHTGFLITEHEVRNKVVSTIYELIKDSDPVFYENLKDLNGKDAIRAIAKTSINFYWA